MIAPKTLRVPQVSASVKAKVLAHNVQHATHSKWRYRLRREEAHSGESHSGESSSETPFASLITESDMEKLTDPLTCRTFLRERGYYGAAGGMSSDGSRESSREERNFPLAYILTVHKGLELVERIIRAIYRPWNVMCVHVAVAVNRRKEPARCGASPWEAACGPG